MWREFVNKFPVTLTSLLQSGCALARGSQHLDPRGVDVEVRIGSLVYTTNEQNEPENKTCGTDKFLLQGKQGTVGPTT